MRASLPPRAHLGDAVRSGCEGILPLSARLEPWQRRVLAAPSELADQLAEHGSPLNLIDPSPMGRNAAELRLAAARFGLDLGLFFARKANKAIALVDEARHLGIGIDLASERELVQALDRGVPGEAMVMTAAVKPIDLVDRCLASGTLIAIDNADELRLAGARALHSGHPAQIALRLAPDLGPGRSATRFGLEQAEAIALVAASGLGGLRVQGVHFHLDGYAADDRVRAIAQALELFDALRARGHEPRFIDIGGGIPMSYLDDPGQWTAFWEAHRDGLLGRRAPLTFDGHGLGLVARAGEVVGAPAVYPAYQDLTRGAWLDTVLSARAARGARAGTVASTLRERGVELRAEPGRALLDGCGLTAARVAFRKRRRDGDWLIGLEMNRTQCRSAADDFLVDPLLVRPAASARADEADPAGTACIEGYLVGAYCIERELLTWRRMRFPQGVRVGDMLFFPNTAGYMMHILESSSHQIPLARNLVVREGVPMELDPIDLPDGRAAGRPAVRETNLHVG